MFFSTFSISLLKPSYFSMPLKSAHLYFLEYSLLNLVAFKFLADNSNISVISELAFVNNIFPCELRFSILCVCVCMTSNFGLYPGHFEYYVMKLCFFKLQGES